MGQICWKSGLTCFLCPELCFLQKIQRLCDQERGFLACVCNTYKKEERKAAEYMRPGFAVKAPFVDNHGAYGVH